MNQTYLRVLFAVLALVFAVDEATATGSCAAARQACVADTSLYAQGCCYQAGAGSCRQGGETPQACVGRLVSETCDPPYYSCLSSKLGACANTCNNACAPCLQGCGSSYLNGEEDCRWTCSGAWWGCDNP